MVGSGNIFDYENFCRTVFFILHKNYSHWSMNMHISRMLISLRISYDLDTVRVFLNSENFLLQVYSGNLTLACNPRYCIVNFFSIIITSHDWYDMHRVLEVTLCLSSSLQTYWTPLVPGTVEQASWLRLSLRERRALARSKHVGR